MTTTNQPNATTTYIRFKQLDTLTLIAEDLNGVLAGIHEHTSRIDQFGQLSGATDLRLLRWALEAIITSLEMTVDDVRQLGWRAGPSGGAR